MSATSKGTALRTMVFGVLLAVPFTAARAADPAPLRVVADPSPNFHGVWVDTLNNELIVTDDNAHAILVYSRTASGPALPLRSIQGLSTALDFPSSIAVDVAGNLIWTNMNDTSDRATAHTRTDSGNALPFVTIDYKDVAPLGKRGYGLSVDTVNAEVVVTFQRGPTIMVFDTGGGPPPNHKRPPTTLAGPHRSFHHPRNHQSTLAGKGHDLVPP